MLYELKLRFINKLKEWQNSTRIRTEAEADQTVTLARVESNLEEAVTELAPVTTAERAVLPRSKSARKSVQVSGFIFGEADN